MKLFVLRNRVKLVVAVLAVFVALIGAVAAYAASPSTPGLALVKKSAIPALCKSCHGAPPATGRHSLHWGLSSVRCNTCHNATATPNYTIKPTGKHQNGVVNVVFDKVHTPALGGIYKDSTIKVTIKAGKATCTGTCHYAGGSHTHNAAKW